MNPGPHFPDPLNIPEDVHTKLHKVVDVEKELGYVFEAIKLTRKELKGEVPLIGFSGAPWTLFAYMIEGGGSKTLQKAKSWLYLHPSESKDLLHRIAVVCAEYLVGQVKAGAQVRVLKAISLQLTRPSAPPNFRLLGRRTFTPRFRRILVALPPIHRHRTSSTTEGPRAPHCSAHPFPQGSEQLLETHCSDQRVRRDWAGLVH